MTGPVTNQITYNQYIQQIGLMAVSLTEEVSGVYQFIDTALTGIVPSMLNYAELRIQRDLDLLASQASNTYTLVPGTNIFALPADDFFTVQTLEVLQSPTGPSTTLLPVSKEFIQNVYSGSLSAGTPQYYAFYGDTFGGYQDTNMNILFGPSPNFAYTLRVTGTQRQPSLYSFAVIGLADSNYTWLSAYLPDMLIMSSMVYISAFQRNFSATSDDTQMGMTYEKQYQALRLGAIADEDQRKAMGSGWSAYPTPTAATQTR